MLLRRRPGGSGAGQPRAAKRLPDEQQRNLLPEFIRRFREEPLLYTPLSHGGHPRLILKASLAQMMLRGLVHNLAKQGLLRETYQLLRLARSMEAIVAKKREPLFDTAAEAMAVRRLLGDMLNQ